MPSPISSAGRTAQYVQSVRKAAAKTDQALERLSTGKRINRPSDDPSGFVSAEGFRSELVRLQAELKGLRGKRLSDQKKDSGLAAIGDQLIALRGLLVEASSGPYSDSDRELFEGQISASLDAVERLRSQFAEAAAGQPAEIGPLVPKGQQTPTKNLELLSSLVDQQISTVVGRRTSISMDQRFSVIRENLIQDAIVINTDALSQTEDADFAEETANLAAGQILTQSSLAALAVSSKLGADQITELLDSIDPGAEAAPAPSGAA